MQTDQLGRRNHGHGCERKKSLLDSFFDKDRQNVEECSRMFLTMLLKFSTFSVIGLDSAIRHESFKLNRLIWKSWASRGESLPGLFRAESNILS